ncbi:LAFA_0G01684g1_1 [Lachancea sp. 'fantastica']|nr:LAFA_0G01684g1_1 [Lachancea sp. 'fantastica']
MGIPTSVKRSLRLCGDFEYAMPVIAYYLKLYVVEELLGLAERDEEVIENATKLLNEIEEFKQGAEDEAVLQLLKDQHKAMVYCLNFALSLYNEQLAKIQANNLGNDLSRALWCCVDLLTAILALWGGKEATKDEVSQCQKRIKMCKLLLSKLARGELGANVVGSLSPEVNQEPPHSKMPQNDVQPLDDEEEEIEEEENESDVDPEKVEEFIASLERESALTEDPQKKMVSDDAKADTTQESKETDDLIRKMRELDAEPVSPEDSSEPELQLPQAPTHIGQPPVFLDDENIDPVEEAVQPTIVTQKPIHYNPDDLKSMWNREDQIAAIQKTARFAISALNYEDLKTAKLELTKALQQLEEIE